jgi:hypothetical protein
MSDRDTNCNSPWSTSGGARSGERIGTSVISSPRADARRADQYMTASGIAQGPPPVHGAPVRPLAPSIGPGELGWGREPNSEPFLPGSPDHLSAGLNRPDRRR